MIDTRNLGADLAVLGSIISAIGVIANNGLLSHILAMQIWAISNPLMAIYFYGNMKGWWDGKLSSSALCLLYILFTVTGLYGLMIS